MWKREQVLEEWKDGENDQSMLYETLKEVINFLKKPKILTNEFIGYKFISKFRGNSICRS